MRVHVSSRGTRLSVPVKVLQALGKAAMRDAGWPRQAEIEVALVDDATIARLNRRFLGHFGPTDVLTFPARSRRRGHAGPDRETVVGEIVISIPRARDQARRFRHTIGREVALLLAHGVLHLQGYRDDTPRAAARMLARAERVVERAIGRTRRTRRRAIR